MLKQVIWLCRFCAKSHILPFPGALAVKGHCQRCGFEAKVWPYSKIIDYWKGAIT